MKMAWFVPQLQYNNLSKEKSVIYKNYDYFTYKELVV